MSDQKLKLEVNDLKISFRTNNGRVQAVRDISFDLYEGETLAIVGESGSGKSVTSRAIMGILAPNAIVESGEILYDGKDLMQITEEEFHSLRGDKISMVFQDPLSSLNPIVKIGKQLTEAMILKNRLSIRENRKKLNRAFKILGKNIDEALNAKEDTSVKQKNKQNLSTFKKFVKKYIIMQNHYNISMEKLGFSIEELSNAIVLLEKDIRTRVSKNIARALDYVNQSFGEYSLKEDDPYITQLKEINEVCKEEDFSCTEVLNKLLPIKSHLENVHSATMPNFFSLGYYLLTHETAPDMPVEELNEFTHKILDDEFMLSYIQDLEKGVLNAFDAKKEAKKLAIEKLQEELKFLAAETLDIKETKLRIKALYPVIHNCENPLKIGNETYTTTFKGSMNTQLHNYFNANNINAKNEKKYLKEKKKFDRIIAKGKKPSYTIAEVMKMDPEQSKKNMQNLISKLICHYEDDIKQFENFNVNTYTISIIDYLKELSANIVKKVSKRSAKERAIRLMEEVGIPDPKKRFKQYPFQFSGGMRQRIVIAIALSADPDVLICDEPTTALDVTIQAQILELINKLKKERNLSIIFITHDLGVVANMADRIAVMYAGKIVESATTDELFYDPKHPYTWALLSSIPDLDTKEKLSPIPGTPPNMIYPPKGDAFAARNKYAMKIDFEEQPPLFKVTDTHYAATWLLHPSAPKVTPPSIVVERIERMLAARREAAKNGK